MFKRIVKKANFRICPQTFRGIIWSFVGWISLEVLSFVIFYGLNVSVDIIGGSMTGITIIFGYFFTHYLETQRKQQEKKLEQYWQLLKAIRVFIMEKNLTPEEKKKLASKFQDAYFGSSLFISSEAYKHLKTTIEMLVTYIKEKNITSLDDFTRAQSGFINCLRKELGEKNIEFNTYDLR